MAMGMQKCLTEHIVGTFLWHSSHCLSPAGAAGWVKSGTFNILTLNEKTILREQLVTRRMVQHYAVSIYIFPQNQC
jgi:hypothetical protein